MSTLRTDKFFDPATTFFSGQCFRFQKLGENTFEGVVRNRVLTVTQGENHLAFTGVSQGEFEEYFTNYFDLQTDYREVKNTLCEDPVMRRAIAFAPGLRLLNQDFWETLCSFIISQNNNIPRITGIIERLCRTFGEQIDESHYTFPDPHTLAQLTPEELGPIRAGFRAKYLVDAAKQVAEGTVRAAVARELPLEEAVSHLCQIKGVGEKVAHCVLLYGAGHTGAFPKDVWMKRAVDTFYGGELPPVLERYPGIAQLFLFYYIRNCSDIAPQPAAIK